MGKITFREAINDALSEEMERDNTVFIMGEDVGYAGGVRAVTRGLYDKFGAERAIDTPISEASIAGAGVGAAIAGSRPVVEIMYGDFVGICMDELMNKAAKWRYMHSAGDMKLPVTYRISTGGGFGGAAEHSQSLEALFSHIPGLYALYPTTPYDAKGLLKAAIRGNDPVLFFEHRLLYNKKGEVPEEDYIVEPGKAKVRKEGNDLTIVGLGKILTDALELANELEKEDINIEVIDLRTVRPLDKKTIIESVEKTGALLVVEEGVKTSGIGAEIGAIVAEEALFSLRAPIKRVGALDVPIPYSPVLEKTVLPDKGRIREAIDEILQY